ncbi:hypothetical protein AK812_SmicGene32201 [Symbiodinium microadriaticum]|uniref:Uncharacterized protein n=1 Tax=Symbiodinium microadriaticum TaxID=2951 RepID=A0A1Q9CUV1_SYMMI|nr:hypothetical protein AK812_SmicGene32201 [Symbiodinium microadriaticum]
MTAAVLVPSSRVGGGRRLVLKDYARSLSSAEFEHGRCVNTGSRLESARERSLARVVCSVFHIRKRRSIRRSSVVLKSMRLFGVPKREENEPVEAEAPQLDSARSVGSGESPAQSSKNSDNASFGQMKLVIKNTFIGGYDEEPDEDPPRTLARSASDSKLDCTSSASSVLFWYPQRKDSMSRSNSSVMSRSDAEDIEDSHLIEHGPAGPYHMVYGRSRATEGSRQSMRPPQAQANLSVGEIWSPIFLVSFLYTHTGSV